MGRTRRQNEELRQAMTFRIARGMTRSAAASEVARIFGVSTSTAYKSYLFDDMGNRRVPLKKSNVALEYNKAVTSAQLTVIYRIMDYPDLKPETVASRTGSSLEMVLYARKWGPKFKKYETSKQI